MTSEAFKLALILLLAQLGCCQTSGLCCPSTNYCKSQPSDVCCPGYGTCTAGFECSGLCQCIEAGGECCSDGRYCQKGNICVVDSYGRHGCCTDLKCTAYVSSGVTVPVTSNSPRTTTPPVTTPPPEPTVTVGTYYYFTITWYGWLFSYQIQEAKANSRDTQVLLLLLLHIYHHRVDK